MHCTTYIHIHRHTHINILYIYIYIHHIHTKVHKHHIQRKYIYTIYMHIHMYTRIELKEKENMLRVRGQEYWAYINETSNVLQAAGQSNCLGALIEVFGKCQAVEVAG